MGELAEQAASFTKLVSNGNVEVYNEFSLQHELGIFLRNRLATYKVQFERNVKYFFPSEAPFLKKEIDISVFTSDKTDLRLAIELKYPRNGQYPEQMFSFCKDIAFAEQLHDKGFSTAGLVIFAEDRLFYRGDESGIYGFFRGHRPIHGEIEKPTGKKDDKVFVRGSYSAYWQPIARPLMYTVIEVC
jgi:hypothetical protein